MKATYDKKADAKYVHVKTGKVARTVKKRDWLLFDYSESGEILGIEILNASQNPFSLAIVDGKPLVRVLPAGIEPTTIP